MKPYFRYAVCCFSVVIAALLLVQINAQACSRALYVSQNKDYILVGRNLDWPVDMDTNLWILPRGAEGDGVAEKNSLKWVAKYGSVAATIYDAAVADGMNEKGLVGGLLWLTESDYGQRDESRPGLCVSQWLQFCLDNFATVDEAVKFFEANDVQILPAMMPQGVTEPITVHLALADRNGDSAVLEYVEGELNVYRGRDALAMTNSPTQDKQLTHLKQFKGFGGDESLPGNTESENRFVRAAYYLENLPQPKDNRHAVAEILSVMRNVAQPFTRAASGEPYSSATRWRTVGDIANDTYYYESTTSPNLIWVDLKQVDFANPQRLDLVDSPDLVGNVTEQFKARQLFKPVPPM